MPKVVHCKRESFDVYVGRPSQWSNPFKIGIHGTREEVIEKFREWITRGDGQHLLQDIEDLRGKVLGCWCAPKPCHADVLLELANQDLYPPPDRIVKVDGETFRCPCGCNVFRAHSSIPLKYRCNACLETFTGEA